jgi:hypothetical protein
MAGFTVPNATDYASNVIAALDQAEPDSLDFSVLADHRSGIITGGEYTAVTSAAGNPTPAYLNVTLAASEVTIDAVYGSIASSTLVIASAPTSTNTRFDLIVAYNNGGTFQYAVVQGTESASNPVFPALLATQIPLYAVYVKNTFNTSYTTALLVDKRAFAASSHTRTGVGAPTTGSGLVGDVYLNTTTASNTGQSQIYVKTGASTWQNLATYVAMASANTASTLVQRDASGNFAAGAITATSFTGSGAALTNIPGSAIDNLSVVTGKIADNAITVAKLATGAPRAGFNSTRSTTTGNYTLTTADVGKLVELSATSANITVTVPGTGFNDGDRIDLLQTSSNTYRVTIQGDTGVTVSAEGNKKTLKAQWAGATLINRGTNTWVLIGNLTA